MPLNTKLEQRVVVLERGDAELAELNAEGWRAISVTRTTYNSRSIFVVLVERTVAINSAAPKP